MKEENDKSNGTWMRYVKEFLDWLGIKVYIRWTSGEWKL